MNPLRIVIADDEELARSLVREYLKDSIDVEIVAECANGFEAVKAVADLKPDLLFHRASALRPSRSSSGRWSSRRRSWGQTILVWPGFWRTMSI